MPRRKKHSLPFSSHINSNLWFNALQAGISAWDSLVLSADVIGHRNDLMMQALQGKVSYFHPEFAKMWMEKAAASNESASEFLHYMALSGSASPAKHLKAWKDMSAPYHNRVKANAKRLSKKHK